MASLPERVARLEAIVLSLDKRLDALDKRIDETVHEMRSLRMSVIGFAITIAGCAIGIALTIYFTRPS